MLGTNRIKYNDRLLAENSLEAFHEKCRHLQQTTPALLALLQRKNCHVTFFVTGRMYKAIPDIIQAMADAGHEIAWHGHHHRPLNDLDTLNQDIEDSRYFIEKFKPKGFRAPWIVFKKSLLERLKQAGFLYDSSCFDSVGVQYEINGLRIFPITGLMVKKIFGPVYADNSRYLQALNILPLGSNFVFSILRNNYDLLLRSFQKRNKSCIFYLHNWQVFNWPERRLSLLRDKFRYVQRFPLAQIIENLIDKHAFCRLDTLLNGEQNAHFLTFDIE